MVKEAKTFAYHRDADTGKRRTFTRGGPEEGQKAVKLKKELGACYMSCDQVKPDEGALACRNSTLVRDD